VGRHGEPRIPGHPPVVGRSGTYALVLTPPPHRAVRIGRLGVLRTEAAHYVYVGSAFGPGGVAARVRGHLASSRAPHWHIDYLRRIAAIDEVWYTYDPSRREHDWAGVLARFEEAVLPLAGFGASDCRCASHLVAFPSCPSLARFRRRVRTAHPGHGPIHHLIPEDREGEKR